ncbi:DUF559 domain-containing protein [Mycolicibacterium sp. P1-18]|nr:DUF559 domain-containing protein [Mycolicibacterium sp. P1-18]
MVRLAGVTADQLAVGLDPLPDGSPVVVRHRLPTEVSSAQDVVDDVLRRLETIAIELFPAWLPAAAAVDSTSDFDRRIVRDIAHRQAADTAHFGPFLADLAEAALRDGPAERRFDRDVRARGLTRVLADSYGRDGVSLLIGESGPPTDDGQRRAALALDWLADHGVGTWLIAGVLPLVDRYPTWQLAVPAYLEALSPDAPPAPVDYPALAGLPHPASAAEQALERRLARCAWAVGRTWNQQYSGGSLVPPIRVDLMWPAERCVVEIDGPDHRGSLKYAADRRRDNGLTLDGFAVLRFTNDEIDDDPARVLGVIEALLSKKRTNEGNPS